MKPFHKISIGARKPDLHGGLRVAIGHLAVDEKNIEGSFMGAPNISRQRLKGLSELLNDVVKYGTRYPEQRVDLLVLPEVSVPHQWATVITKWAKDHQVGVICGLEHRIDNRNRAWNELLAALPFRGENGSKECAPIRRLKNHYSPEEEFQLINNSLLIPKLPTNSRYQLFQWRGASFAVYNCYELASVEDRCLFKGMVDFIVCSEFNKDVNYFSNIVESAARDLHCYVIQVNSAQFGDSRVVSPSRTETLNPLRIKGGDNQTFLTMRLPLQQLRSHQLKKYGLQKDSKEYKPTPPDFDIAEVKKRIHLGR
ncbi:hypothetical protein ACM8AW_06930 [Pseudomonas aeruginosa]|uniref:hypothetical protein n=1 Tax=Pseudomonas aeruginosa TaxID=287 RepID=UPI0021AEC2BC|nr:hypothetical protein [Pseudomonas aeruginosa]EKX2002455.1 hypothetical protein [Pseudomonas aeruginosa]MCT5381331.1 hypothetical protein [Pseudomonas aeruginosa]MCV0242972.1 hypothetical protein [Pseudomonas aeruginosa]HCF1731315.1 hypothetical protein [Pseudomonas aeruginosa]HCF4385541.1 hypothetical protein [Pseudomonas aeruginosa]